MSYDYIIEKLSLDEIYHHGILGMKWGKKNGPPYPLDAGDHSASEKQAGYKKSIGGGRNENLYDRKKTRKPGRYETATYNKYRSQGVSEEDAKAAAARKAKIAKIVAISAGVTIAGLAGYAAYKKFGPDSFTLKPGTTLQTLSMDADRGKLGDIYAAYKKMDKAQYVHQFGKDGQGTFLGGSGQLKYNINNKIVQKTKIAGYKDSKKIYNQLWDNNPDFKNKVMSEANQYGMGTSYDAFNRMLVVHPESAQTFYKALKEKGFGGVVDANDQKRKNYKGGLQSKAPVIVFDKTSYIQDSVKKLTEADIKKASKEYAKYVKRDETIDLVKNIGITSLPYVATGAIAGGAYASINYDEKVVKESKKKQQKQKKAS